MPGYPEGHRNQRGDRGNGSHNNWAQAALGAKINRLVHLHAAAAVLVNEIDQNDRVGHHNAREHEQADERGNAQRRTRHEHREERADCRERDGHQEDKRLAQALKDPHQHHVDEENGGRHREAELVEHIVQLLGRTRFSGGGSRWQIRGIHDLCHVIAQGTEFVRILGGRGNRSGLLTVDRHNVGNNVDLFNLSEGGDRLANDRHILEIVERGDRIGQLDVDISINVVQRDLTNGRRNDLAGDQAHHVVFRKACRCGRLTVHRHLNRGLFSRKIRRDLLGAFHILQSLEELIVGLLERLLIVGHDVDVHVGGGNSLHFGATRLITRGILGQRILKLLGERLLIRVLIRCHNVGDGGGRLPHSSATDGGGNGLYASHIAKGSFGNGRALREGFHVCSGRCFLREHHHVLAGIAQQVHLEHGV